MRERWKAARKGDEIDLKPYAYKESERVHHIVCERRTIQIYWNQLNKIQILDFVVLKKIIIELWSCSSVMWCIRHGVPIEEWANEF